MRVLVTSCETHAEAWRHQEQMLRDLWTRSSRRHTLTENPAEADIILIGNIREEDWHRSFRENPLIAKYPNKCFGLADFDDPLLFLRGIYTSATRRMPFAKRARSGAYTLYHSDFQNPCIVDRGGLVADEEKTYLFSFLGRRGHSVRDAILDHAYERPDVLVRDTSSFNLFTHLNAGKREKQQAFVETLKRSKFALCPRGNGAASIRLFEAMRMGVAPIIVSDDWILPTGVDWESCALFVKERDVAQIERIAAAHESRWREMGEAAAAAYQACFSEESYFDYIVDNCVAMKTQQWIPESVFWHMRGLFLFGYKATRRIRSKLNRRRAPQIRPNAPEVEHRDWPSAAKI